MILFFLFIGIGFLHAQSKPALEYKVKAAFLYNFTRFINWPSAAFSSSDAPFVIGIIGDDPFGSSIEETVEGEKVDDHPIIVQHYHDVSDITNCQILFITAKESVRIKKILSGLDQNILTVSDTYGFAKWGGKVCFFNEDNKIKIQINMEAVKRSQLEISSKLLRIAKLL